MKIYRVLEEDTPIAYFQSFKKAAVYIRVNVDIKKGGFRPHNYDYSQDWIQVYFNGKFLQNLTDKEFNKTLKENYQWQENDFPYKWLSLDCIETEN